MAPPSRLHKRVPKMPHRGVGPYGPEAKLPKMPKIVRPRGSRQVKVFCLFKMIEFHPAETERFTVANVIPYEHDITKK